MGKKINFCGMSPNLFGAISLILGLMTTPLFIDNGTGGDRGGCIP